MGVLVLVLGLFSAGVVIDFLVENSLGTGSDVVFSLFGGTFHMTVPELVLGAAVFGALAISFIGLGLALLGVSWGRRRGRSAEFRELRDRLDQSERRRQQLERENADPTRRTPPSGPVVDVRTNTDRPASTAPTSTSSTSS